MYILVLINDQYHFFVQKKEEHCCSSQMVLKFIFLVAFSLVGMIFIDN